ncbi:2-octaprenyl-6-methoxyphenyl hydroxylase [Roseovarius litorisediminis]|uniref:2-octaprenyl-6-methoxyphenyl hydroxylase n=1 Tax=Roseovarius litorisediminis TaxID=1312363 RepID=A0A1Y5TQM0_9RHOB|nr:FAD-dependent monooxygenase [Roseovarius litorisediminis]SLN69825.1 2-octaprenyl-6-methoxyphenyl hydroxylase [Roseovarius litorisediminis]
MEKTYFEHSSYDAIIIGARCAGAATALQLSRAGARILMIDRDLPSNDTLSTHALMRPAVALLHDWGLLESIEKAATPLVKNTNFHYGMEKISVALKPDHGVKGLYAPRRGLLDQILVDAAVDAGTELHTGVTFQAVKRSPSGRVSGAILMTRDGRCRTVSAALVIGADGRLSSVAREVGATIQNTAPERSAAVYGYFDGIANEGYRWYFGRNSYAGVIPTNSGLHCVFAATRPDAFKETFASDPITGMTGLIAQCDPAMAHQLREFRKDGPLRRFGGALGHMRQCVGSGWALVGDAGYFKDPITAHGITDAFVDAHRLAKAFCHMPSFPISYQVKRNRFGIQLFEVTRNLAALNWSFGQAKSMHLQLTECIKAEMASIRGNPTESAIAA